jgi:hypothetical protein
MIFPIRLLFSHIFIFDLSLFFKNYLNFIDNYNFFLRILYYLQAIFQFTNVFLKIFSSVPQSFHRYLINQMKSVSLIYHFFVFIIHEYQIYFSILMIKCLKFFIKHHYFYLRFHNQHYFVKLNDSHLSFHY